MVGFGGSSFEPLNVWHDRRLEFPTPPPSSSSQLYSPSKWSDSLATCPERRSVVFGHEGRLEGNQMVVHFFPNNSRSGCNNSPPTKKRAFGGLRQGRSQSHLIKKSRKSDLGLKTGLTYPGVKTLADCVVAPFDTLATVCDPSGIGPAFAKSRLRADAFPSSSKEECTAYYAWLGQELLFTIKTIPEGSQKVARVSKQTLSSSESRCVDPWKGHSRSKSKAEGPGCYNRKQSIGDKSW